MIPLHEVKSFETFSDIDGDGEEDDDLAGRVPASSASLKSSLQSGFVKLHILTVLNGMNAGTHFVLRLQPDECRNLAQSLHIHVQKARMRHAERKVADSEGTPCVSVTRYRMRLAYEDFRVQFGVCAIVLLGFIVDMTEAQYLPDNGTMLHTIYLYCDVGFTTFFTCEVLVNMISYSTSKFPYVAPFFRKWLNIFDLVHAGSSIISGDIAKDFACASPLVLSLWQSR